MARVEAVKYQHQRNKKGSKVQDIPIIISSKTDEKRGRATVNRENMLTKIKEGEL